MPYNLHTITRLSFASHREYLDFVRANREGIFQIWLWHQTLGNQEGCARLNGVCDHCACQTVYTAPTTPSTNVHFTYQTDWWQSFNCGCGMSALDRSVYRVLLDGGDASDAIYHVGHYSPLAVWLRKRCPNLTTSQYQAGRAAGEIDGGIRYESLAGLSFPDAVFDCVIATEILEHIPDYNAALKEVRRVLRPGGRLLMTFPWLGGEHYDHFTRAQMTEDGTIRHIHPPQYHGDPASPGTLTMLSFRDFGWKILDEIREAGFSDASAKCIFGPLHGYVSMHNQVVVGRA